MATVLACSAYGQSVAEVPFDLPKFQPVLSECRLQSPSTSPATVSGGNFGGYELPGRFYLGDDGSTMVLATTADGGTDRSELRHNSNWSVAGERNFSARLRFDRPEAAGGSGSFTFFQIHVQNFMGNQTGPLVMITCNSNDQLSARVRTDFEPDSKKQKTFNLGPRPDGFFNFDVRVKEGILRVFIDDELLAAEDVSAFAPTTVFFKTGAYTHGIKPQAVEFDSLSITAGPPNQPPTFTSDPVVKVDATEGNAYGATIADNANDPENDPLTFWKVSGPAWLNVAANGDLSGTPSASDVGLNSLTVEVSDDKGNIDRATLEIEVYSASAPPTVPDLVVDAGPDQTAALSWTGPWTPAGISTVAWYDASDAATLTESGGAVSQWADKSGHANHLAQGTTSRRPTTGTRSINGLNVLDHDGDDFLERASFHLPPGGNLAVSMVAEIDTISSEWNAIISMNSSIDFQYDAGHGSQFNGRLHGDGIPTVTFTGGPFAGPSIFNAVFDRNAGVMSGFVDGVQRATSSSYTSSLSTTQHLRVFGNRAGNHFPAGAVAEVVLVEDPSDAMRERMEGYLAHKWGLHAELPAEHPYKDAAPSGSRATVELTGVAEDADSGSPATTWSLVSGPGPVTFGDASALATTATFHEAGTYLLRLTADYGKFILYDEVTITAIITDNIAPVADAGPDQTVTDSDGSGSADVTLDGSGSSDADGTIVSYVWTLGGSQIATGVNPTVTLAAGTHTITLTVTDDDGATDSDTVTITVNAAVIPVTYDFGTGARGKTTYGDAGFTSASDGSLTISNQTNSVRFRSTAQDQTGGITQTFTGLGGGLRNDFTITARFTLTDFYSWTTDGKPGSILLFADSPSVSALNFTGLTAQIWVGQNQPYQTLRITGGLNSEIVNEITDWQGDGNGGLGGGDYEWKVEVSFSGVDDMQVDATLTRLNNGDSATVSFFTNNASNYIGGEYFGFGGRFRDNYTTNLDTFSVISSGNAPPGAEQQTYSDWISGFDLGSQTAFDDDYNNDGVPNGLKYYFGIDPRVPSPGLSSLVPDVSDGNRFSFTHPMAENLATGISAEYRWTKDLSTFHMDGASGEDGTTVTFDRGEPVEGMVTVTATINGTPTDRIFVVLVVTQDE